MSKLFVALLGLAAIVAIIVYGGLVLSYLWLWFVVPLGVRPVSVAGAVGLELVGANFTYRLIKDKDEKSDWFVESLVATALLETLFLGLGYTVHLFL